MEKPSSLELKNIRVSYMKPHEGEHVIQTNPPHANWGYKGLSMKLNEEKHVDTMKPQEEKHECYKPPSHELRNNRVEW